MRPSSVPAAIEDTTLEDYMKVINVNQVGTFLGMKAVLDPMKMAGGGSIVNISSIDGQQSKNGLISYTASKSAIRGMTKTAAIEWGRFDIRVNSVHPGGVNTPMGNPQNSPIAEEGALYLPGHPSNRRAHRDRLRCPVPGQRRGVIRNRCRAERGRRLGEPGRLPLAFLAPTMWSNTAIAPSSQRLASALT